MNLQIKSLSGVVNEGEKKYLRKRMLWFEEHLPNNSFLTVGVKQKITKKSNQAVEIILHLILVGAKKPVYVRVAKNNFNEAVDISRGKLERIVLKNKDKGGKFKLKMPAFKIFKRKNDESS